MLPVLFGGIFSLALVYFIKGHISVVALGAGSIVLGIAVNYSMDVFNHYRHWPDVRDVIRCGITYDHRQLHHYRRVSLPDAGAITLTKYMGLFAAFSLVGPH